MVFKAFISSFFLLVYTFPGEMLTNNMCPELGHQLSDLSKGEMFSHMLKEPECLEDIQPHMILYRDDKNNGCNITSGNQRDKEKYFNKVEQCPLENLNKINIVVHGFTGSEKDVNYLIEDLLSFPRTGVITVDWSKGAEFQLSGDLLRNLPIKHLIPYQQAAANTRYVGAAIAIIIQRITKINPSISFHCIGHSLGAHVCGFVGKALLVAGPPQIQLDRISGLDPAGPLFMPNEIFPDFVDNPATRLDATDAKLVDVIHTDGVCLGSFKRIGHLDFYPGQKSKPGFDQPGSKAFGQSHSRSKDIYKASITKVCKTSQACSSVSFENGCLKKISKLNTNAQAIGYSLQPENVDPGVFTIESTNRSLSCLSGDELLLDTFDESKHLPNCLKLKGVIKNLINGNMEEAFSELFAFLHPIMKTILKTMLQLSDFNKRLSAIKKLIKEGDLRLFLLRTEKRKMQKSVTRLITNIEHSLKKTQSGLKTLAKKSISTVDSVFDYSKDTTVGKSKDRIIDAKAHIIFQLRILINKTKTSLEEAQNEMQLIDEDLLKIEKDVKDFEIRVAQIVDEIIEKINKTENNAREGRNANIIKVVGKGLVIAGCTVLDVYIGGDYGLCYTVSGILITSHVIQGVTLHMTIPELKKIKYAVTQEEKMITKNILLMKSNITLYRALLAEESEAMEEWSSAEESLRGHLFSPNTILVSPQLEGNLKRLKFEAQEYLETIKCNKFEEIYKTEAVIKVSIIDGSGDLRRKKNLGDGSNKYVEGEEMVLKCAVDGCPTRVQWFNNDEHWGETSTSKIFVGDRILWISSLAQTDEGRYKCEASRNGVLVDSAEVEISMLPQACLDKKSVTFCEAMEKQNYCIEVMKDCCKTCRK